MSTLAINSLNQGFYGNSTNPSGAYITRRARLTRVFVVASLALLLLAAIANRAGAGASISPVAGASTYVTVTVAPGDTLWSLSVAMADGSDIRSLMAEIVSVNSLVSYDLAAGQKLRIPLK